MVDQKALAKEATISGLNADLKSLQKQLIRKQRRRKRVAKKVVVGRLNTIRSMDMHFKVKVFGPY